MEARTAKVLDRNGRIVIGMKRKRAARHASHFAGASNTLLPQWSTLYFSTHKLGKRRKLAKYKSKLNTGGNSIRKSLIQYYSNFMKTKMAQRILFFEDGQWSDFPQILLGMIKKDFEEKKAAIEVELNGQQFVLDFLHMLRLDLKTGLQQPIAWIDEAGSCFFPEVYISGREGHNCCHRECGRDQGLLFKEPYGCHEIKLQLEIDISGRNQTTLKEGSGESNSMVNRIEVGRKHAKPGNKHCIIEVEDSCDRSPEPKLDEAAQEIHQIKANLVSGDKSVHEELDTDAVIKKFVLGISPSDAEILDVYQCSSVSMQARLELFEKQVEITKRYRGDANVKYAWLPCSKAALSTIIMYGLGNCGSSVAKSVYGIGVHLAAENCSSARYGVSCFSCLICRRHILI